jgi:hypothetical protein
MSARVRDAYDACFEARQHDPGWRRMACFNGWRHRDCQRGRRVTRAGGFTLGGSYDALALGTDLTALILNGFGATTGTPAAKAGLAYRSKCGSQHRYFLQKTLPALVSQMRGSRQTALENAPWQNGSMLATPQG